MRRVYEYICTIEALVAKVTLVTMVALVFSAGIARLLRNPINWAVDISLLLFAWGAFLGADVGIRKNRVINVDFLTSRLPMKTQKTIAITWSVIIILFLAVLIAYGIPLCISNFKRQFQNITLSYSFVTASLPVSAFLMIISTSVRLHLQITDFPSTLRGGGRDAA